MLVLTLLCVVGLASSGRIFFAPDEVRTPDVEHIREEANVNNDDTVTTTMEGDEDSDSIVQEEEEEEVEDEGSGDTGHVVDYQDNEIDEPSSGWLEAPECAGNSSFCLRPANYPYAAVSKALEKDKLLVSRLRDVSPYFSR
jgi:hypothetical protein